MSSWAEEVKPDLAKYGLTFEEEYRALAEMNRLEAIWRSVNPSPPEVDRCAAKPWWRFWR